MIPVPWQTEYADGLHSGRALPAMVNPLPDLTGSWCASPGTLCPRQDVSGEKSTVADALIHGHLVCILWNQIQPMEMYDFNRRPADDDIALASGLCRRRPLRSRSFPRFRL